MMNKMVDNFVVQLVLEVGILVGQTSNKSLFYISHIVFVS